MNWFWKKYYRALIVLLCLSAVCAAVFINYRESTKLKLPDRNSEYDIEAPSHTYEMDDYIILTEDGSDYEIVHKETGAKRKFLNDPFDDGHHYYSIHSVSTYQNKVYYGLGRYGFFCYDADKDTTEAVYKDLYLRLDSYVITLFDVVVFNRAVTISEIEKDVTNYFIYNGNLVVVTDKNIFLYDGKSERELLKGNYRADRFKDGIMELSTDATDREGNKIRTRYRYDIETGVLLKIGEEKEGIN